MKQIMMYRLMTAEGWERAILGCANGITADLETLFSQLFAPIPSSKVSERHDGIIEFPVQ